MKIRTYRVIRIGDRRGTSTSALSSMPVPGMAYTNKNGDDPHSTLYSCGITVGCVRAGIPGFLYVRFRLTLFCC